MLTRAASLLVPVLYSVVVAGQAWAGGVVIPGGGNVECGANGCHVTVGTPGNPGGSSGGSGGGGSGGSSEDGVCTYEPTEPGPQAIDAAGGQPPGPGRWYYRECFAAEDGTAAGLGGLVWLTNPPPTVSPATLARIARAQMDLPTVGVAVNPRANTLVGVPMWLAVTAGWQPRSATATVPGVAVTVTATPSKVAWAMGDGGSVVCRGQGTVFRPGIDDPYAASPTCGYRYRRASGAGQFAVTATVAYTVAWSGGGQSGTLADLTAVGTTSLRVDESQAIVAN